MIPTLFHQSGTVEQKQSEKNEREQKDKITQIYASHCFRHVKI